jgi:cytochrome b561
MIVDAERSLLSAVGARRRKRQGIVLHLVAAVLVVFVGVLGLLDDSWLRNLLASWINVHALFGLLLWGLVVWRFYGRARQDPPMRRAEIRSLSRRLSRMVYLLLYLVIGTKQVLAIATLVRHGGTLTLEPTKDFQAILLYGLITLIIIRILAVWVWLHVIDEAASRGAAGRGPARLQIPSN